MSETLQSGYHVASPLYADGDRIPPGNWGRIILGYGPKHPLFYREYLFEKIRQLEFADRNCLSRLSCAFVFESFTAASGYQQGEYIYRVRLADPNSRAHRADITWLTVVSEFRTFQGVEDCVRHYWRGDQRAADQWEWLIDGELVVEERLTLIPENGGALR